GFFCWFHLIFAQNIANNCAISFSGELDIAEVVFGTESVVHNYFERFDPGPAGIHQRSINIEKEEALLCHVERSRDISSDLNPIQVRDSSTALGKTKKYRARIARFLAVTPSGVEGSRRER